MKRYRILLGIALMAIAAFLVGQATPQGSITPDMIFHQGEGSGLDADAVDSLQSCLQTNSYDYYATCYSPAV